MCQILFKPKGYSLSKKLLESTCTVNADGFGYMMFEDGKVKADKAFNGNNDAEVIGDFLTNLHEKDVFLHFRYRTKGKTDTESCHPFKVFDELDRQVYLMHNGTLSGFGSDVLVDSKDFGDQIVGPLYGTFLKSGVEKPLHDPMFQKIIQKFVGSESKIVLLDNASEGLPWIVNRDRGEEYEDKEQEGRKFWVSNTYSFNSFHRSPKTYNWGTTQEWRTQDWDYETNTWVPKGTAKTWQQVQKTKESGTTSKTFGTETEAKVGKVPTREMTKMYWRDILKVESIDVLVDMTNDDISELVELEPHNAKLLIKDLLFELYQRDYESEAETE